MRGFKSIKDYPNYLINRKGDVYSIKSKKTLKALPNIKGYLRVALYDGEGFRLWYFVSRLVAQAYVHNPDPKKKTQVNHDDFNIENNYYKNLTWMSASENIRYNRNRYKYRKKYERQPGDPF